MNPISPMLCLSMAAGLMGAPISALAHSGRHEGSALQLIRHWFSQPDHLLWLVVAIAALVSVHFWRRRHDKD